jgi:hypothetical protein
MGGKPIFRSVAIYEPKVFQLRHQRFVVALRRKLVRDLSRRYLAEDGSIELSAG